MDLSIFLLVLLALLAGAWWWDTRRVRLLGHFPARNPMPVFRLRSDGTVRYANAGARQFLTTAPDLADPMRQCVHEGAMVRRTYRHDAQVFQLTFVPLATSADILAYGHDITDLSRARDALEASYAMLTQREAQLRAAEKYEALGHLAAVIAHDANNMLGVILSSCDMLRQLDAYDPGTMQPILARMMQACRRSASLMQRLLTFGAASPMKFAPFELNAMIREVNGVMRSLAGMSEVVVALAPDLPAVRGDQAHLEQVVFNLLVNARDALAPEGGDILVYTFLAQISNGQGPALGLVPGDYVCLAVRDNGCGIDREHLGRVCEPFYTTKDAGTGLGLSQAYGVMIQHGGVLAVTSPPATEPRGTEIQLYLPVATDDPRTAPLDPAAPPFDGLLLLVDDEPLVIDALCPWLTHLGFDVHAAESGEAALAFLDAHTPCLTCMITDLRLPGMRGGELAEAVRRLDPTVPVLFISAYEDAPHMPMSQFLRKPFTLRQLQEALAALLAASDSRNAPSEPIDDG